MNIVKLTNRKKNKFISPKLALGFLGYGFFLGCSNNEGSSLQMRAENEKPKFENEKQEFKFDVEKLKKLIENGYSEIKQGLNTSILVIGDTGTGKSTLINALLGVKLKATEYEFGIDQYSIRPIPGEKGPEIGDTSNSVTTIPQLWVKGEYAFWDCPGFEDTKGPIQDIANAFYINRIFENSKEVKILLVISNSQLIGDRTSTKIVKKFSNIFKDITSIMDSLSVVITKVGTRYKVDKYRGLFRAIQEEQSESCTENEKIFYEFLANKGRLELMYAPKEDGIYAINETIINIVHGSKYMKSPQINIPIADSSRSAVYKLIDESKKWLKEYNNQLVKKIISSFDSKKDELKNKEVELSLYLSKYYNLVSRLLSTKEDVDKNKLQNYYLILDEVTGSSKVSVNIYPVMESVKFCKKIVENNDSLSSLAHHKFDELHAQLNNELTHSNMEIVKHYNKLIQNLAYDVNSYSEKIGNEIDLLGNLIAQIKKYQESKDLLSDLDSIKNFIKSDNVNLFIAFGRQIKNLNNNLPFDNRVADHELESKLISELTKASNRMQEKLDSSFKLEIEMKNKNFNVAQQKLKEANDKQKNHDNELREMKRIIKEKDEMALKERKEFEYHKIILEQKRQRAEEEKNEEEAKRIQQEENSNNQLEQQRVRYEEERKIKDIEEKNKIEKMREQAQQEQVRHQEEHDKKMKEKLEAERKQNEKEKERIACEARQKANLDNLRKSPVKVLEDGNAFKAYSHQIKISSLVNPIALYAKNLYSTNSYLGGIFVNIFGAEEIHIDTDMCIEANLFLVAPKIFIDNKAKLKLSGRSGSHGGDGASKYRNYDRSSCSDSDIRGDDGRPGESGMPGGHCVMIADNYVGLENLTIDVSGGNGGDGGRGGNGNSYTKSHVFWPTDGSGGNGGDGGMGGKGGEQGTIKILSSLGGDYKNNANLIKNLGNKGKDGDGGKGGEGWKGLSGDGKDGSSGENGKVSSRPCYKYLDKVLLDISYEKIKNSYNYFFNSTFNDTGLKNFLS
jgi:hypothetical protein